MYLSLNIFIKKCMHKLHGERETSVAENLMTTINKNKVGVFFMKQKLLILSVIYMPHSHG
jgi:hypothetical protein